MIPKEVSDIAAILEDEFEVDHEGAIEVAWRIYNAMPLKESA